MSEGPHLTLVAHLVELRRRVLRSLVALLLATCLSFGLLYDVMKQVVQAPLGALDPDTTNVLARYNPVMTWLRPHVARAGAPVALRLHAMTAAEPFLVKFKLSLLCGLILSAPFILYQGWAFVGAGLIERERRAVRRWVPLSLLLFLVGVAFAYFVALPVALCFLLSVDPEIEPLLMVGPYVSMVAVTVALFGLAFQMPLAARVLAGLGSVSVAALKRGRPYAIVLMFVVGALLTPPDPFTQCLLAAPLVGLYELGILLAGAASKSATASRGQADQPAGKV